MPKIDNVFTQEELDLINNALPTYKIELDEALGRIRIGDIKFCFSDYMMSRLEEIAKQATGLSLSIDHAMYVEYNEKYGRPNLPPHFDGDKCDLIINFQLSANTSWNVGLNTDIYELEDNSALIFNGNTEVHWRPHKNFKNGEYVKMIFVRFFNRENTSDYSYLSKINTPTNDIFKEAYNLRESLNNTLS